MCGYELRKKMEQLQGYTRKFSDGAIYPATNRLVEAGLISEQASIRDGRQRRVFTLLDAGRAKLIDELKSTSGFNLTDFTRWTVVLTFLSVVPDKTDRDAVLRRRYDLLNGHDVHFFYCDAGNPLSAEQSDDPYRKVSSPCMTRRSPPNSNGCVRCWRCKGQWVNSLLWLASWSASSSC